ncbi:MAG TPA: metal ABC transporter substrate-binding protein [Mycobacteriales bacterium]|nr:metal ABC transporter substrate-binding protein [Mycobacteriales bacterium]
MSRHLAAVGAAATCLTLTLTSCTPRGSDDDRPTVVAAFYPVQFLAETLGGDNLRVLPLAKPGAEPHDLELSPRQVSDLASADLVLYQRGLQPAVDDALRSHDVARLDITEVVPLERADPHVWLDPVRFRTLAAGVAARLAGLHPAQAPAIGARAVALDAQLGTLDEEFRTGLSDCARRELVTSHGAFGYLASRYGLDQIGLTGLRPDAEVAPRRLAEVAEYARKHGVTTIFFEELVSPRVAEQLAREVGARTAILSPLESRPEQGDYLSAMRSNLATLRTALTCQ